MMKLLATFLLSCSLFANKSWDTWTYEQLQKEFAPFADGITEEMLQNTMDNFYKWSGKPCFPHSTIYRYRVVDSAIYTFPYHDYIEGIFCLSALGILEKIIKKYPLPDCEFIYLEGDFYIVSLNDKVNCPGPIFVGSKNKKYENCILFHDYLSMNFNEKKLKILNKYSPHETECILAYDWPYISKLLVGSNISWPERKSMLFWRGRMTDHAKNPPPSPRELISIMSNCYPNYIDAALTDKYRNVKGLRFGTFTSILDHLKFKYQIALDGWTSQYPGYVWRLLSNSLVFKQESEDFMWFEAGLKEDVHYVKVKHDLSDLLEKIQYYQEHDDEALKIAANAREFVLNNAMPEHVIDYCYKALMKYISLQKFSADFFKNNEGYFLLSDPLTESEKQARKQLGI